MIVFTALRSRPVLHLLARYVLQIVLGVCLSALWKNSHPATFASWGRFYALWLPVMYAAFSTGYMVLRQRTDVLDFRRSLFYDDLTCFGLLWILGAILVSPYFKNIVLVVTVSCLVLLCLKAAVFMRCLYLSGLQWDSQVPSPAPLPFWFKIMLLSTAFAVYGLVSAYHQQRITTTGDEPHYLLITHSLWYDHDKNLHNNYQNQDYKAFYWEELRPTWGDRVNDDTVISYRHKGMFPHTLLPGYILGGRFGATLQMNLVAALLMVQVFILSYDLFHSLRASFLTWLCVGFTIPMSIYMGQIYPETLAALLVVWATRQCRVLVLEKHVLRKKHILQALGVLGSLFALVLVKTRYLPIAGSFGGLFLAEYLRHRVRRRAQWYRFLLVIGTVSGIFVALVLLDVIKIARFSDSQFMQWMLQGHNPLSGVLGLLFDQEYGLLFYSPVYILAILGIGLLSKQECIQYWPLLAIVTVNALVIGIWPLWHAAPTPPVRYLLPVLPLLGVFCAKFFVRKHALFLDSVAVGSCLWSGFWVWSTVVNPWWRYNWADGTNNFLEMLGETLAMNLPKFFPSFTRLSALTPVVTIEAIGCIGVLLYICRNETSLSAWWSLPAPTKDFRFLFMMTVFTGLIFGSFVIEKKFSVRVFEAEDRLDVEPRGGERIPADPDPWHNQRYLREWGFSGWKLAPGASLLFSPKLSSGWFGKGRENASQELQVYARVEKEDEQPAPELYVFIDGEEAGRFVVQSKEWERYSIPLFTHGINSHPHIEVKFPLSESQAAVVIDKFRIQ